MNRRIIPSIILSASLPLASFAQYTDLKSAFDAIGAAHREKRYDDALRIAQEARSLAKTDDDRDNIALRVADTYTYQGKFAESLAVSAPIATACTNISSCSHAVRMMFIGAVNASVAVGDFDTLKKLMDQLSKQSVKSTHVFWVWTRISEALVRDAQAQRKKPKTDRPADAASVGGSTFGLWTSEEMIGKNMELDAIRLAEAENVLLKLMPQDELSFQQRFDVSKYIVDYEFRVGDEAGNARAFNALLAQILDAKPANAAETNVVNAAILTLFNDYLEKRNEWHRAIDLAGDLSAKMKDALGEHVLSMQARIVGYYYRAGADTQFNETYAKFASLPVSSAAFEGYMQLSRIVNGDYPDYASAGFHRIPELLRTLSENKATLTDQERFRLAETLFDVAVREQDVDATQKYYAEMRALEKVSTDAIEEENRRFNEARAKGETYDRLDIQRISVNKWYTHSRFLRTMFEEFSDEAVAAAEDAVAYNAGSVQHAQGALINLGVIRLAFGKDKEADAGLEALVTNTAFSVQNRFIGKALQAVASAKDMKDFTARINALRQLSDSAGNAGESATDSEKRFFTLLRLATRQIFDTGRVENILAIIKVSDTLKHPEARLLYTARYLPDAPSSADGAVRAGLFESGKLPVERRFAPHETYCAYRRESELSLLKSLPPLKLDTLPPEKSGGVIVAYDDMGVHIYMQFNDPNGRAVRAGLASGAGIELTVMPGEATSYHQTFYTSSNADDTNQIEWDTVHEGYRMTRDSFKSDGANTDTASYCHTFIPWVASYNSIPENGGTWRMVLVAGWGSSGFRSLGGGRVHELGRGMQIQFDIPPAIRAKIRAGVVMASAAEYSRSRSQWENAEFWADPHMGDGKFYEAVVTPFIAKLDAESKLVKSATADKPLAPAEIERLFNDFVPQFADFKLKLDAKRADYIEEQLFRQ